MKSKPESHLDLILGDLCLLFHHGIHQKIILPETNIAPENRVSQKESSLPTTHFQGLC